MRLGIDPGMVNRRLIQTVVGEPGQEEIDRRIGALPKLPEHLLEVRVDHIYTQTLLAFCEFLKVPSLGEVLATEKGALFCSTEFIGPCPEIYEVDRADLPLVPKGNNKFQVRVELTTNRVRSDTTRGEFAKGAEQAIVGRIRDREGDTLVVQPLVIGGPWLHADDPAWADRAPWYSFHFFEHFVEDVDEFQPITDVPKPSEEEWQTAMQQIQEQAFKQCLAEILGEEAGKDWGGETSDHYSSHLTLSGARHTAAFLLKGPSSFKPMGLNHLGKNNDQIVRLASEPASLLVVQHAHEVLPAVRETLRVFAVQPGRARRYLVMDGRDSYRLLVAKNRLEQALDLSSS